MKKNFYMVLVVLLLSSLSMLAQQEVDFDADFADWSQWVGKTVSFTNDFYLCNASSRMIAPHRLRAPEEYGEEGTAAYDAAQAANEHDKCYLSGLQVYSNERPGAIIRNLVAQVTAANQLQLIGTPTIIYNELPTRRPDLGNANVVVCGTNLQNFFVTLGGYAGAADETQLECQKTKISKALYHMDADIYGLCEVEQGPLATTELVRLLNELAGRDCYAWVNANFSTYNGIMVCYIYRKDRVRTYSRYLMPYSYAPMKFREAIQCFEHIDTGERFNVSINHFYAKTSKTDADREENMRSLITKISTAVSNDPDVLVIGDLNAYTMEESNLLLSRDKKYVDLLMRDDPTGYSYVYDAMVGYLDHAYCSPSMAPQVTRATAYHLNADTYYRYGFKYGDNSMYRYSDHDPILVGLHLGPNTAVENISAAEPCRKVLRDGMLLIERGGAEYTVTGTRLK